VVGADLSIPGHPEILVTGDVMSLDKLPGVAEVARPLRRIRPRPEAALSAEAPRADDDQQDRVQQQLQR
jgi:DNA-binding IclR family transcriptional regulator